MAIIDSIDQNTAFAIKGFIFALGKKFPQEETGDQPIRKNAFGGDVFDDITISLPNDEYVYSSYDSDGNEIQTTFEPITFDSVNVSVIRTKEQKEIKVNGKSDPVVVFKGDGQRVVTLKLTHINTDVSFPYDPATLMQSISEIDEYFKVTSKYLNDVHDINHLYVKSCKSVKNSSTNNITVFELTCRTIDTLTEDVLFFNDGVVEFGSY